MPDHRSAAEEAQLDRQIAKSNKAEMFRRIAVLTPVLDDWDCFARLVDDISEQFAGSGVEFHLCAIDDGSIAGFDPANLSLPAESCVAGVEIIRLALNLGHQRAIAVGLSALCRSDCIDALLVMDSDGEDRPSDIVALLEAGQRYPGRIILARRSKRSERLSFRWWYWLYKLAFHALTGHDISFGNYSVLPIAAVRRLVHMPELWNNLAAAILRSRLPCTEVPTERGARYNGRSRMNLVSLIVHGLSAMSVHIDTIFVRVLLASGVLATAVMIGIAAIAFIRFATPLAIPGWASNMVGDLLIILVQTIVMVVAASLMMLAGRSATPVIPIIHSAQFIAERKCCARDSVSALEAERALV
jgi:polyisoprenyl-phosphate glycosyltransferase